MGMWTDRYCNSIHVGGHCPKCGEVSCYSNLMESAHAVRGVVNSLLAAAGQAEVTLIIEISEGRRISI